MNVRVPLPHFNLNSNFTAQNNPVVAGKHFPCRSSVLPAMLGGLRDLLLASDRKRVDGFAGS